ncbi:hypothetical protein BD324DRAFT_653044 [Kockovaella imperatae]|uniref:Uncharacterized protein n=1 Tax=Kockovaella imperatae TaxID=4999 RepID=A0A1Y1UBA9_9TREE|nr:hypothetical protein BD324DRAFT_653044 [Kockovaella imperatae]ORX34786.1 hypothetical protein BD324DRAFT_653044 [Kockovaella imperatae]
MLWDVTSSKPSCETPDTDDDDLSFLESDKEPSINDLITSLFPGSSNSQPPPSYDQAPLDDFLLQDSSVPSVQSQSAPTPTRPWSSAFKEKIGGLVVNHPLLSAGSAWLAIDAASHVLGPIKQALYDRIISESVSRIAGSHSSSASGGQPPSAPSANGQTPQIITGPDSLAQLYKISQPKSIEDKDSIPTPTRTLPPSSSFGSGSSPPSFLSQLLPKRVF